MLYEIRNLPEIGNGRIPGISGFFCTETGKDAMDAQHSRTVQVLHQIIDEYRLFSRKPQLVQGIPVHPHIRLESAQYIAVGAGIEVLFQVKVLSIGTMLGQVSLRMPRRYPCCFRVPSTWWIPSARMYFFSYT